MEEGSKIVCYTYPMPWYVYALIAAMLSGATVFFAKSGLKDADPLAFALIRSFMMVGVLVIVFFIMGEWKHLKSLSGSELHIIFWSALVGALSWVFFFIGLKKGSVAGIEVVDRMSIVFAILFAILFLGETLTIKSAVAVLLVLAGGVLMII
jgi:bacterial/archaeal transporter family protein